jgi:hypothetical protein
MYWYTRPVDQGQMVHVSYSTDGEVLYRRQYDRSDRTESYDCAAIEGSCEDFEPWNGKLPSHDDWEACEDPDPRD